jgi:CDP-diglyceride synthetase
MIGGFFACFAAGPIFVILLVVMVQGLVYKEVIFLAAVPSKEKKLPWFRSMNWYVVFFFYYYYCFLILSSLVAPSKHVTTFYLLSIIVNPFV